MHPVRESIRAATLVTLVMALAACGGDDGAEPDVPTPGLLTVGLETPNATEGAVLFSITGPAIGEITPYDGAGVVESHAAGSTTTVAVFGSVESGPIARVAVPDTRKSYTVHLQQVAGANNVLYADLEAHSLSIAP